MEGGGGERGRRRCLGRGIGVGFVNQGGGVTSYAWLRL